MFTNSNFAFRANSLKCFSIVWVIAIIAPLIYFPVPAALVGHPWKVELVVSFILFTTLTFFLSAREGNKHFVSIAPKIASHVVVPGCAFILWSAFSVFWADSIPSVVHHTLVWACYLTFFLFAIGVVSDKRLFKISVVALGSVLSIVCLCCILEFVFEDSRNEIFGSRYGRYAEIFAASLPLFFSLTLRLNRKKLWLAGSVTAFLWLGLLFAMSRASLVSSIIGLSVFIFLRIFSRKTSIEKRRLIFAVTGLIFIVLLMQISLSLTNNAHSGNSLSRISLQEEESGGNSLAQNVRFLFAGVGKEMFFDNYLVGVGADNFGLNFNKYRAVFSADSANKTNAAQQEEYVPERAHNEYLQIAAELGAVGSLIFLLMFGGIAKLGFAEIVKNRRKRSSILTHAAIGGILAFLISSCFSSYSFRLMQNGLVFFFLLAILLRNSALEKNQTQSNRFAAPRLKTAFAAIGLIACLSLTVFSALKATSQFFVYQAERQASFEAAESFYEKAILLDSANASANYSLGMRFLGKGDYQASAAQLRQAVKKGLNDSVSYSYLITAQTLANQPEEAVKTAAEAVEIFPYSVFLRVRYAALLDKFNEKAEAENQLKIARQLNNKQAETWRLLITEGSLKASQEARANKKISTLDELVPALGLYAVLAERDIVYPDEKSKFSF